MKTIYKYQINIDDSFTEIPLPINYKIVKVDNFGDEVFMWVELETDHVIVNTQKFRIYGTGHKINKNDQYIGTAILRNGYVWHVYKIGEVNE